MRHPLLHRCRTWITLWVIWAFALVPALSFLSMQDGRLLAPGLDSTCLPGGGPSLQATLALGDKSVPAAPLHDGIHCPFCLGSAPPALPAAEPALIVGPLPLQGGIRPTHPQPLRPSTFPSRYGLSRAPPAA